MTHLYTRGCEYALRALTALASDTSQSLTVVELCEIAEIPEPFTRKMLQQLVRAKILSSTRGRGGGISFAIDPSQVTLLEVVQIIEDSPRIDQCILGNKDCDDSNPCPLHFTWKPVRTAANEMLGNKTIADLGIPAKPRGRRKS